MVVQIFPRITCASVEQPFLYSVNLSFCSNDKQSELDDAKIEFDDTIPSPTPFLLSQPQHM